jgi:hypothetical protein
LKVNDRRRERLHIQISKDVADALEVGLPNVGPERLRATVNRLAAGLKGLNQTRFHVLPADIRKLIDDHFGSTFFEELGLSIRIEQCRMSAITTHSLVMLAVLARAFGIELTNLLREAEEVKETGAPIRWNCANAHSFCRGKPTIDSFSVVGHRAWFTCPICRVTFGVKYPFGSNKELFFPAVDKITELEVIRYWHRHPGNVSLIGREGGIPFPTVYQVATQHNLPRGEDVFSRKKLSKIRTSLERLRTIVQFRPQIRMEELRKFIHGDRLSWIRAYYPEEYRRLIPLPPHRRQTNEISTHERRDPTPPIQYPFTRNSKFRTVW